MFFQSPGAVLLTLGPVTIRWYGIMVALGFLSVTYAATKLAARFQSASNETIDPDKIVNLALTCFVAGIIGARLYFVALSWQYFHNHLGEIIFSPSEGLSIRGLSIHGGLLGAIIAGVYYCKRSKLPVLRCCDLIAACLPLGQAIGRWGNFFNSEAFGKPVRADFPLKLFIPAESRPPTMQGFEYFHPTFLYECVWNLFLFLLLYFYAVRRLERFSGLTFFLYIGGYSLGRILVESLRTDSIMLPGTQIAAPTAISFALLAISLLGSVIVYRRSAGTKSSAPESSTLASAPPENRKP